MTSPRCMNRLFLLANALFCIALVNSTQAQTQQKLLQWSDHPVGTHPISTSAPHQVLRQLDIIEIQEITLHGQPLIIGEQFVADQDWLRDIVFRVKNISDREIIGIQITLVLPEMKKPPQVPYVAGCRHDKNQPCIRPGEVVEVKLGAGRLYDWLKSVVASETNLQNISRATVYVTLVSLAGDIEWSSGCVKTANPKNACPGL